MTAATVEPEQRHERRRALLVDLAHPAAAEPAVVGAKATNLAIAARSGFAVLPGFALTTTGAARGLDDDAVVDALRAAWDRLSDGGRRPLVVRSSSTVEDASSSSMAGQFTSVLDVRTWDEMRAAVGTVLRSAREAPTAHEEQPMAVLVQQQLDPLCSGVLFGVDPIAGDSRHVVADVVAGRPDELVSGRAEAAHYVLTRHGRTVEIRNADVAPVLTRAQRRALARLARRATKTFSVPQDVEWAVDGDGKLRLLQSRPVTATGAPSSGPLLGPGPVAETFPEPLYRLEQDLWLEPLREGIVRALVATNVVSKKRLRSSPVLTAVGGRVAVDLELLGVVPGKRSRRRLLDPRPGARRLSAAWRVGRLRVALPSLVETVLDAVDADLAGLPALADLDDDTLLETLDAARRELATAHSYEVLMGMLLHEQHEHPTAAGVALHTLARARRDGLADHDVVARHPVVLALVPPSLTGPIALPERPASLDRGSADVSAIGRRDALRLRNRWLQELLARIVRELAARLAARGSLPDAVTARDLTLDELHAITEGAPAPADLRERAAMPAGPPLPVAFRVTAAGEAVPEVRTRNEVDGIPAGGGRGVGRVRHRIGHADGPTVLVVAHLEPQLASALPDLAGLVAESGSPLSHLAILAREYGVPTVVGVHDARRRFPPGTQLLVDGTSGEVGVVETAPAPVAEGGTS